MLWDLFIDHAGELEDTRKRPPWLSMQNEQAQLTTTKMDSKFYSSKSNQMEENHREFNI